jgi:glycerol-3-phosphate acyltransferase PlsY
MKTDNLKRIISYVFTSTGAVLFLLAVFVMFTENKSISAGTILEIIGANTVITIGLFLTYKVELRYPILEFLLDIGFMVAVIILSGTLFNWYSYIPVWVPVIMVIVVYILFYLLDIIRVRKDIKEINKLLQKLKEKETKTASW